MALVIVIRIGDFQTCLNVLSLSFSERESRKWPLDFYHNYLISDDCIQQSGKITYLQHLIKTIFLYSNMTFLVGF